MLLSCCESWACHQLSRGMGKDNLVLLVHFHVDVPVERIGELNRSYLEVQDIRFEHQLQISLPDDEDLIGIEQISVPVMLLQIYAENPIEHGINERSKAYIIQIEIEKSAEYVHIILKDDGKGFTSQTNTNARTDRKSSTQMIEELASICNKYNTLPLLIEYVHLIYMDPISHQRYETQVNISLPIHYKYVFE